VETPETPDWVVEILARVAFEFEAIEATGTLPLQSDPDDPSSDWEKLTEVDRRPYLQMAWDVSAGEEINAWVQRHGEIALRRALHPADRDRILETERTRFNVLNGLLVHFRNVLPAVVEAARSRNERAAAVRPIRRDER
jgi:hypothetical protein